MRRTLQWSGIGLAIVLYTYVGAHIGWLLAAVLGCVLASEFVNGWTDAPNAIATVVATRALPFKAAIAMAVVLNIAGALAGTAVAVTMGKGIVDSSVINLQTIAAALVGIILFGSIAARFGIPTSESHALVAGLTGAALATAGPSAIIASGWVKVGIGVVSALTLGYGISWALARLIRRTCANVSPVRGARTFRVLQILAAAAMAFDHGLNDGQKFIGVFTLALVMGGQLATFAIPLWVIVLCAATMGIGTSIGGKKIIATLGERVADIQGWQGFAALVGASGTIFGASLAGIPLSTTHTIVSSVTGAGASRGTSRVRWKYPREILIASALTFPVCGLVAYTTCWGLKLLTGPYGLWWGLGALGASIGTWIALRLRREAAYDRDLETYMN